MCPSISLSLSLSLFFLSCIVFFSSSLLCRSIPRAESMPDCSIGSLCCWRKLVVHESRSISPSRVRRKAIKSPARFLTETRRRRHPGPHLTLYRPGARRSARTLLQMQRFAWRSTVNPDTVATPVGQHRWESCGSQP